MEAQVEKKIDKIFQTTLNKYNKQWQKILASQNEKDRKKKKIVNEYDRIINDLLYQIIKQEEETKCFLLDSYENKIRSAKVFF